MATSRAGASRVRLTAEQTFRKAVQAGNFERVYFFHGDEELLKEEGVQLLIDATVDAATRDFNLDVRSAATLGAEALASLLGTPPMMAERRMLVVRDVSALKRDARAALDRYLASPSSEMTLVLVEPGGERGKPDKQLLALPGAVAFEPLSADRLPKWIAYHTGTVLGAQITDDAVDLLASAVGSDLPALASELDKLASYASGAVIDEDAVSAVLGVRRGETMADLISRVAHRDVPGALSILGFVLDQPKVNAVQVVMALTTQVLALGWADAALRSGLPRARLYGELFDLLKRSGGAYTGMPWGEAVKLWNATVPKWNAESVDRALRALLAADATLKSTRISTDEQILTSLLLELSTEHALS